MKARSAQPAADGAPRLDAGQEIMAGLLHFIRERRFEPGERLPSERELAERFEVSRNTIRELLSTLEWFRMVERRPSSGVYLREEATDPSLEALVMTSGLGIDLNEQEVLQSMETRYLLELQAVRLCCQRRTDADVAAMKDILDKTAAQIDSGQNIAEFDTAFHLAIVAGTQNAVLVRVVKPFYLLSGRQRSHYFIDVARARKSLADHRKLFNAIANRDEDAALGVLVEHLGVVENYWRKALGPVKDKRKA
jgi:GntR family transcriptional repressor for pyruvate dehydrogenase complex